MSELVRLDKYLADMRMGTRSEVKKYIRKGRVQVDGIIVKESDLKLDFTNTEVLFDNIKVEYETFEYYMLNKPAGVVSATSDNYNQTVVELITDAKNKDLFPVGRLDKDTEGLLLITNDGDLAHRLLSPRKHVSKVYYAEVEGLLTQEEVRLFAQGIALNEEFTTLPARLDIIEAGETSTAKVTIFEGKFHQIKRMFESVEKDVIYLKRLSMGNLILDKSLAPGEYRRLTKEELASIK